MLAAIRDAPFLLVQPAGCLSVCLCLYVCANERNFAASYAGSSGTRCTRPVATEAAEINPNHSLIVAVLSAAIPTECNSDHSAVDLISMCVELEMPTFYQVLQAARGSGWLLLLTPHNLPRKSHSLVGLTRRFVAI